MIGSLSRFRGAHDRRSSALRHSKRQRISLFISTYLPSAEDMVAASDFDFDGGIVVLERKPALPRADDSRVRDAGSAGSGVERGED